MTTTSKRITKTSNPMRYFLLQYMPEDLWSALGKHFGHSISDVTRVGFTVAIPAQAYDRVALLKQLIEKHGNYPCIVGVYRHRPVTAA